MNMHAKIRFLLMAPPSQLEKTRKVCLLCSISSKMEKTSTFWSKGTHNSSEGSDQTGVWRSIMSPFILFDFIAKKVLMIITAVGSFLKSKHNRRITFIWDAFQHFELCVLHCQSSAHHTHHRGHWGRLLSSSLGAFLTARDVDKDNKRKENTPKNKNNNNNANNSDGCRYASCGFG